ncbi:MAG: polysaccharide deacetylase family protein [Oscillospiraceae bacterium]|nr:polysaccharide deacetylase family protein [Oscillospiraceae bacterium]
MSEQIRYFGSVRFYKNILLLLIVLLVAGLAALALFNHHRYAQAMALLEQSYGTVPENLASVESDPLAYQALYPDFYAPQEYAATTRLSNVAYLTFNGGPSSCTDDLLPLLAEKGAKATFFVSGNVANDPQYDARLRAIVEGGHTLGMGSWSSDYSAVYSSVESYLADMYALYTYIENTTGIKPTVFRFIGGSINSYDAGLYHELIAEMLRRGFVPYDWNLSADGGAGGTQLSAEELVLRVEDSLTGLDRAVLLLHDDSSRTTTLEAMPGIIDCLQQRGFSLAALTPEVKPVLFAYPE